MGLKVIGIQFRRPPQPVETHLRLQCDKPGCDNFDRFAHVDGFAGQYAQAMRKGWKDTFAKVGNGTERVFYCPVCSGKLPKAFQND